MPALDRGWLELLQHDRAKMRDDLLFGELVVALNRLW
jgi:hypothetical protein